jgi:hypothetical protein
METATISPILTNLTPHTTSLYRTQMQLCNSAVTEEQLSKMTDF